MESATLVLPDQIRTLAAKVEELPSIVAEADAAELETQVCEAWCRRNDYWSVLRAPYKRAQLRYWPGGPEPEYYPIPKFLRSLTHIREYFPYLVVFASDIGADGLALVRLVADTAQSPIVEYSGMAMQLERAWLAASLRASAGELERVYKATT